MPTSFRVCSGPRIRGSARKLEGLIDGHIQDVPDVGAFVLDFQGFPGCTASPADVAGHINVREEVHLDLDDSVSAAGLAPPPLDVEAISPFLVAPERGTPEAGRRAPGYG